MLPELERLIEEIQDETRYTRGTTGVAALSPVVADALRATPRERFVPEALRSQAYENRPLPVGHGQTISQPFIVAIMTQLLLPRSDQRILEIGAGSGYQAAVLARLAGRVVSLEIIPELAAAAELRLRGLGIDNVDIHCADGHGGWPPDAPYDGIIVTACATRVPDTLLEQLKPGGRMILPVGEPHGYQDLQLIRKAADGSVDMRPVLPVAFVPMTRDTHLESSPPP